MPGVPETRRGKGGSPRDAPSEPRMKISYRIPDSLRAEVNVRAAKDRVTPSTVVRRALRAYLNLPEGD